MIEASPWPDDVLAGRTDFYGIRTSALVANESRWVHRRVERIELIDERRARRHMSVDFTLPFLPPATWDTPPTLYWLVPVALLRRQLLTDLNVRDSSGAALPVLTRDQNAAIASRLLVSQAQETLVEVLGADAALNHVLTREFADIAGARRRFDDRPDDTERRLRTARAIHKFRNAAIRTARSPDPVGHLQNQRQLLWRDQTMRGFMTTLADRFLLLVPIETIPGTRLIVKVSYEETLETLDTAIPTQPGHWRVRRERVKSSCGLRTYPVAIGTRSLFGAESYHVEIVAPEELVIESARLDRIRSITDLSTGSVRSERTCVSEDFGTERAHLYENLFVGETTTAARTPPSANEEIGGRSTITVDFFIRPSFVRPSLMIGLVTCAMLLAGLALKAASIHRAGDVTALIVVLPAGFAAYLIPGEHRLVRRMFEGLRFLVFLLAMASFAAAATLTLGLSSEFVVAVWIVLLLVASTSTAIIAVAFRDSRRKMTHRSGRGVHSQG